MSNWLYTTASIEAKRKWVHEGRKYENLAEILNEFGANGWELVSIVTRSWAGVGFDQVPNRFTAVFKKST